MITQLKQNQFMLELDRVSYFQSYQSIIAKIDYDLEEIEIYQDFEKSQTTGKYRNKFFDLSGFSELNSTKKLKSALKKGTVKNDFGYDFKIELNSYCDGF